MAKQVDIVALLDQPDIGAYHREPGDHGARCGCVLSE